MLNIEINLGSGDAQLVKKVMGIVHKSMGCPIDDQVLLRVGLEISERELGETHLNIKIFTDNSIEENYTLLTTYDDYTKEMSLSKRIQKEKGDSNE